SWRHTSRFLCEMYGDYLQTEIVQMAHHGNVGCERALYETIAPRVVLVANDSSIFRSRLWFSRMTNGSETAEKAFLYAADVWCAINAEYTWSAPANTYNTLTFKPARPDYENVTDVVSGVKLTNYVEDYPGHSNGNFFNPLPEGDYIHNSGKGRTEVNVYWGELSFTYNPGSIGTWNTTTHRYEGAVPSGWVADGENKIWVENASSTAVNVQISYTANTGYSNFTGTFKDKNGDTVAQNTNISLGLLERKEFEFILDSTSLPASNMTGVAVGSITVKLS
ncbi:MAG: hypothetical protein J6U87_05165, partial [Clostridia bacterium]|nr:hypothetical protein [Clostridia bacterium]